MNVNITTILIILLLTACAPDSRQTTSATSVSTLPTVEAAPTATPPSPAPAFTPTPVAQITSAPAKTTPTPTPDHSSEIKLATIGEGPCCPRWSPDGQKIAFAIGTGLHKGIYVVDRNGNNFRKLVYIRRSEGDSPPIMPAWTEDSQQILYWNNDEIFSVAADGSSPPQRYNQPAPHVPKPVWFADYQPPSSDTQYYSQLSPDGQYLALTKSKVITPALEHGLYLIPQATAQPIQLFNTHTYTDSLLNFSLRYPTSWALEPRDGTNRNDGSGRTIQLVREDYLLAITAQFRPDNPGGCGGVLHREEAANYRKFEVDGVDLWRPEMENGFTNGYSDGTLTFASVISPAPDRNSYVCVLEIDNRLFTIDYRLPVSLDVIEAGRHRADILAEMDEILQSIQWTVESELPQPTITLTPPGYDATVTAVPGESPPDEISQIKAANANQPEIVAPLFTPDGQWQAQTRVYGCVEIGSNQVKSYEELVLTDLNAGTEVVAADQLLNCGGLGAAGLAALFWSSSGRYLYYTNARDGVPDGCGFWQPFILRWDRATGQTEQIGGGVASPDDTRLAVWARRERAMALWNLDGGELGRVPAAADAFPGQMAWSPDSRALVYLQVSSYCPLAGPSYLVHVDVDTLEQTVLLESGQPVFHQIAWEQPNQLRLIDESEQAWIFKLDSQTLEPAAQNQSTR